MNRSNAAAQVAQLIQDALTHEVDPTKPVTSLHALEQQLKDKASEISAEEWLSFLEDACLRLDTDWADLERSAKLEAKRDKRYSLLVNFAREHDTKAKGLASIVWQATWPIESAQEGGYHVECALQLAKRETGEARATALLQATETLGAKVYEPYLRSLITLSRVTSDKFREVTEKFGVLVATVTESKAFSAHRALVDPVILLYRNSCAHRDYEFDVETGGVKIWGENVPPRTVALSTLENDVERAYEMAGPTFLRVRALLAIRDQSGLNWDAIGPALISGDEEQMIETINSLRAELLVRVGPGFVLYRDWRNVVSASGQKGKAAPGATTGP